MGRLTHTVSGNLASFTSADPADIESLKLHFAPLTLGVGDPSPTNVYSVNGWRELSWYNSDNMIEFIPIDSAGIELNGGTLDYLGKNTFFLSGQVTANSNFQVPIQPFTFIQGHTYKDIIIIETQGAYQNITQSIGIGAKYDNQTWQSRIISNPHQTGTYSTTFTWASDDQEINKLVIAFKTGWADVKIRWYIVDTTLNENTLSWASTVGTLYGGYVDLISGKLIKTHKYVLLNDANSWTEGTRAFFYKDNLNYFADREIDQSGLGGSGHGNTYGLTCTIAIADTSKAFYCRWTSATEGNFAFRWPSTAQNPPTLVDIKSLASNNKIGVIYKLATPVEYQLTPQQLQAIRGKNYFWSNSNADTEITYDFTDYLFRRRIWLDQRSLISN